MARAKNYRDLVKAHRRYIQSDRHMLFEEYLKYRDTNVWQPGVGDIPVKDIFLLFGLIVSIDPEFQGNPEEFLYRYQNITSKIAAFKESNLVDMEFPTTIQRCIAGIFEEISRCTRTQGRTEANAGSIILTLLLPDLFVVWNADVRKSIFDEENSKDGKSYAEFLVELQREAREILSYGSPAYKDNLERLSKETDGCPLPQLLSEYLYIESRGTEG